MEQNLEAVRKQGLGVVAISYDSAGALKDFADRKHITYPLLSDPESRIIRAYGILNETVKPVTPAYGIPYPGVYVVDVQGKIISKYFEDDYADRVSTADILARQFGVQADAARRVTETKHLQVTTASSNEIARPALRIVLSLDITLKPGMHVYAPGVQGYIPIDWRLDETGPAAKRHAFQYPPSERLRLEAIGETVPVYRGHIRLEREITFGQEGTLKQFVSPAGELIVKGTFRYQACDHEKCYVPQDVPLEWHFEYAGLDRQRVPPELQHKPN